MPQKSIHVKGWCGLGQVWSLGDFDSLDSPRWVIRPQYTPGSQGDSSKQKKTFSIPAMHTILEEGILSEAKFGSSISTPMPTISWEGSCPPSMEGHIKPWRVGHSLRKNFQDPFS